MIRFRSRDGQTMFAFDWRTDPISVMVEFAWAWTEPDRQSVCGSANCPTVQGGYCLDCHCTASDVVAKTKKRMAERDSNLARWSA